MTRSLPITFAAIVLSATALLLAVAAGASAEPPLEEKQAQAQAILAEVQRLDEQVGAAAERWNGANLELGRLQSQLTETRRDLAYARGLYKVSQARVAERLRFLYMSGQSDSALDVILGARSLDDVIARLDATQRIAAQDAQITRQARALRARVTRREAQLATKTERQSAIVEDLASEKRAIEATLAERERLLASVKDEVARLQEAERQRQTELRRQAQRELERQQRAAEAQAAQAAELTTVTTPSSGGYADPAPDAPEYSPPPADASKGAQVVAIAMQYLGVPYVWGGASPATGFDCSGLTMYVFAQVGVSLPHYAAAQYRLGYAVSKSQLQPGDLVFFRALGHMGMYIGGGNFIHAPRTGDVVKISSLSESYYVANWVGARRVL